MSTETHRFFRASPELYEFTRAAVDTARGYPSGRAETAFQPIDQAVIDSQGRALLAVEISTLSEPEIISIFSQAYIHGFEEITREIYFSSIESIDEP